MECSLKMAYVWILSVGLNLMLAAGFCVAAGVANASFFGSPGAPVLMGIALAFTLLAAVSIAYVRLHFNLFEKCVKANHCDKECLNIMQRTTTAILGVIFAVTAAVVLVSGAISVAWIPWGGSVPIGIALAGLVAASLALTVAIVYLAQSETNVAQDLGHPA